MIRITLFAVFLLFCGCGKDNPVNTSSDSTGKISGRVVNQDSEGIYYAQLYLEGTSFYVRTDSTGYYCFYNVPPGQYKLMLDSYLLNSYSDSVVASITLAAGTIYSVGIIAIHYTISADFAFSGIVLLDPEDSVIYEGSNFSSVFISGAYMIRYAGDTIKAQMTIYNRRQGLPASSMDSVVVFKNSTPIDTVIPVKGRIKTCIMGLSGMDTLQFSIGGKNQFEMVIYDTLPRAGNSINITTGRAGLTSIDIYSSYSLNYSPSAYIFIDSVKYFISNSAYDTVDWDILFINDSTHDTCYWGNINPDWGVAGDANDNPRFSGDYLDNSYGYFGLSNNYRPDLITSLQLQNGSYSVCVRMTDALPGIDTATPTLSIQLGYNDKLPEMSRLIELSPNRSMHIGEEWYAGKLYLPDQTFNSGGQTILPKRPALSKKQYQ